MSIGEKNLSGNAGGQNFRFWNKPFAPEKIKIEDTDDSSEGTASVGVKPQPRRRSTNPNSNVGSAGPSGRPKRTGTGGSVSGRREYGDRNPVVSEPQIQDGQTQFDSHTPIVSKTRPKLNLDPFQESIYYSLIPVENTLRTEVHSSNIEANQVGGVHSIPITSSSVVGESGSGLTLMLAKKAYENYQDGRPTIILTHREHLFHKVAQSIVDFAEPSKRDNLLKQIEVISAGADLHNIDPSKKIYILSTDKLKNYLTENPSYRQVSYPAMTMGAKTWRRELEHNKLSDILPLRRVREVLVDEVNRYTGTTNEGFSKVLTTLMQETSTDPERNPVHLFGTSSTPYARSTEGAQEESRYATLEFDQLFPELSRQVTPNPRELIEEAKFYKRPVLSTITLDERIQREMPHTDAKDRLIDAGKSSINDNIVSIYENEARIEPGKKWHIIANTREHANQLCALFNTRGVNAKVATSSHKGHFEPLSEELSETDSRRGIFTLNDAQNENDKTPLRKVSQKVEDIIDDYENGDCNVLIDIDHHSCIHSTKTDKVVALNLEETDSRTKHLLGEAVKDRSGPQNQTIEYMFLRSSALESFRSLITDDQFNLDAVPKSRGSSRNDSQAIALRTETGMSVDVVGGIEFNRNWLNNGLRSVLENKYPDTSIEEAAVRLTNDFYSHRASTDKTTDELKLIVSGLTKDTKVFSELISFIEEDLRDVYQAELRRNNFNLREELTTVIPDLMGVANEKLAQRVLSRSFENLVMNDEDYNPDEEWQARMDAALGLGSHERGEVRENFRNKRFTEIISRKFGLEFFENRSFLQKALKVFNGAETDFKLFGLLVNTLVGDGDQGSGRGFSFDNIRQEFPHLLGSQRVVPFGALQRKILAKYPDGPPMDQGLTRFFREQLYDDFAIDFATLTNSVTNHSRATDPDQEIIDGSVQGEIYNFLESVYTAEANVEMPADSQLRPSKAQFKTEVEAKAKEHLSTVTREVLYNQLIAKIWGQGRSVRINNDDFVFRLEADELSLAPKTDSSLEDQIDMTKVNPDWLLAVDHGVNGSSFDRIDMKKRIAVITAAFLAHKNGIGSRVQDALNTKEQKGDEYLVMSGEQRSRHNIIEAELNPQQLFLDRELNTKECRELKVLLGQTARSKLTQGDKSLLREFLEFHNIKLKTVLPRFYDRLGVESLDEAKLVVKEQLSKIQNSNKDWMNLFGSQEEFVDLVTKFIFENNAGLFNNSSSLVMLLSALAGNTTTGLDLPDIQSQNRKFIDFANQNGLELKTEELVLNFRDQIGLKTKEELFALMRQDGFVDFGEKQSPLNPNRYQNRTAGGVKSLVAKLADKLQLSPSALFALADLKEPNNFYKEPLIQFVNEWRKKIDFDAFTQERIIDELGKLLPENSDSIKARQLLIDAYGEEYKHRSVFTLPEPIADLEIGIAKLRVDIRGNQMRFTDEEPNSKYGKSNESKRIDRDFQEYEYIDGEWKLTQTQDDVNQKFYRVSNIVTNILQKDGEHLDHKWLAHLGITKDTSPDDKNLQSLIVAIDSFMRYLIDNDETMRFGVMSSPDSFIGFIRAFLGDERFFAPDKPAIKRSFRDFIEFINTKPDFLDGARNPLRDIDLGPIDLDQVIQESPKLTGVQSFDELKSVLDSGLHNFTASNKASDTLSGLAKLTGTSVNDMLNFSRVDQEVESYKKGSAELGLDQLIFDHTFQNIYERDILRSSILNRLLFEHTHNNDFCKFDVSFPVTDGKDIFEMVFSQDRISIDLSHERDGVTNLVNFRSVDKVEGKWERKIASDHEVQTRRAFISAAGSFDTRAQNLIEAMKQAISPENKFDYLAFSVSSLITEFLEVHYPSCFGETDIAIVPMLNMIFGMSSVPDSHVIPNQFIDFAKAKHSGFDAIRQDPRFKEIFFETEGSGLKVDSDQSPAQDAIDLIREANVPEHVQKLFKTNRSQKEIITLLIAQPRLAVAGDYSMQDIYRELEVPRDIPKFLGAAFSRLADAIDTKDLVNQDADVVTRLRNQIKTMPASMPPHRAQEFEAQFALKKLFPDTDFNYSNPASRTLAHLVNFSIRNADGSPSNMEYNLECDGETINFFKREKGTENFEIIASVNLNEKPLSEEQKIISYIRSNISDEEAFEIYKNSDSAEAAYHQLLLKAEAGLGLPTYDLDRVSNDLKVPYNLATHLKTAFSELGTQLAMSLTTIDQRLRERLIEIVDNFPISLENDRTERQNLRAIASFKTLFPNLDLSNKSTQSRNNLIQIPTNPGAAREYYIEYDGDELSLLIVKAGTNELLESVSVDTNITVQEAPAKAKLSNQEAIALLREKYPDGINDPNEIHEACKELNIDYDALINSIDVDTPISNLTNAFSFVAKDYGSSLRMNFGSLSPSKFMSDFFDSGSLRSDIALCLLKNKIWTGRGVVDLLRGTTPGTPYFKLLTDGSFEMKQVRSFGNNAITGDEIVTFTKDPATDMYIPYKDGEVLTLRSEGKELDQQIRNLVSSQYVVAESKRHEKSPMPEVDLASRLEAVLSYLQMITGKSETELFEFVPSSDQIETKYNAGFRKILTELFPQDSSVVSSLLTKLKDSWNPEGNMRLLKLDHLIRRLWGSIVDPYKQLIIGDETYKIDQSEKTRLHFIMKPEETRVDLYDASTNLPLKLLRATDYVAREQEWTKITEYNGYKK